VRDERLRLVLMLVAGLLAALLGLLYLLGGGGTRPVGL
jgi:hypothetical protein